MAELAGVSTATVSRVLNNYPFIKEKNLKISYDIGFIMFDDPVWATLVKPKVTAISQPVYTLGSTTADLLFKRIIDGGQFIDKKPVRLILETELIVRESV